MEYSILFHFLFLLVQHTFDFSTCFISLFSPFIFCGKGHSICVNSCFGERKFHTVNYMYVATCSHKRIRLSQLLGRTLVMVFTEYTRQRIRFHLAIGYCTPTIADRQETKASLWVRRELVIYFHEWRKPVALPDAPCTFTSLPFCYTCCWLAFNTACQVIFHRWSCGGFN